MNQHLATPSPRTLAIAGIAVLAWYLRLQGINFGLPSLLDPDEPIFMIIALKLILNHTLNPGWFGHPGSTTIYSLALVEIAVFVSGYLSGQFANAAAFASAVYHDPGIMFLPARYLMVGFGVLCVVLTYLIGRRLFDARTGLFAAALLATNPLHIKWSQIVRTDVHAGVFMLLCILASIAIARRGRLIDYIWAGAMIGLATATKWPTAVIAFAPLCACAYRIVDRKAEPARELRFLAVSVLAAPVALFIASPFLVIDAFTVVRHVSGEEQLHHLGATGGSMMWNLGWYIADPLGRSMGVLGLVFTAAGAVIIAARHRVALATLLVPTLVFLLLICSQRIIWARGIVPIVPMLSVFAAVALCHVGDWIGARVGRLPAIVWQVALATAMLVPMLVTAHAEANERRHETRSIAAIWAKAHIPAGSRVVIEHLGFDMVDQPWTVLTPAGHVGCVDAVKHLKNTIGYDAIDGWRSGKYIVDLGTIDPGRLETCRAEYAILSDYDRYRAEAPFYREELGIYAAFLHGGRLLKTIRPVAGQSTGPVVRIVGFAAAKPVPPPASTAPLEARIATHAGGPKR